MTAQIECTDVGDARLYRCDYATLYGLLAERGELVDAVITDPPYSSRTHDGHSAAACRRMTACRDLDYAAWSPGDVERFVAASHAVTRGWICALTDHHLGPHWQRSYDAVNRVGFSPIACVETGSRVRLAGDGPAQWSTWLMVSRPRTRERARWGALPGAYVVPRATKQVVGGKPVSLMRSIVGDYSRLGDTVCDPCAGGGTTLVAAIELGRRAIGCEPDAGRYAIAAEAIRSARRPLIVAGMDAEQLSLGGVQ